MMDLKVIVFSFVLLKAKCDDRFYKTDLVAEKTENRGFVEPLDFAQFTAQFFHGGESSPFTDSRGFDFFGAESKTNAFPAFAEPKQNRSGFVAPINFASPFDGEASPTTIYKPKKFGASYSTTAPETESIHGKTNQGSKPQTGIVYANSADVEVFYPPGKAILPQLNGRPRPYDGYRAAPAVDSELRRRRELGNRRAQQFRQEEVEGAEEDEEEERPRPKSSGYKYQYDSSVHVPDLVIKKYPYERTVDNDEEFTHDYERYIKSLPGDLEKHFGTPDHYNYRPEDYTVAATENLQKDENCEKIEPTEKSKQTCYICRNPKTGGSYEQCAYEVQAQPKKYVYGGSKSSSSNQEPKRQKRSPDFFTPSSYEYFVYGEPNLKRRARAEKPQDQKRKSKKYRAFPKKQAKRKPRKLPNPSADIENPPRSYDGPRYTYEGPSEPYEGPKYPYEGPSHDDYYDRTDDRIPYENNPPLLSSFFDDDSEDKKRPQRNPSEYRPSYLSDYRFGPEFFDEPNGRPEPLKRDAKPEQEEFFAGNVKIFKNGDVCEKMKKESMVCMVCNNDKTGAKYEQCQYSSSPSKKGYTYGSQKSFSSDRPQRHARLDLSPEKSDTVEQKILITKVESKKTFNDEDEEPLTTSESKIKEVRKERDAEEGDEESEAQEAEAAEEEEEEGPQRGETIERVDGQEDIESLDEFLGRSKGSQESTFPKEHESYEDYFKRVFPEFDVYKRITPENFDPFAELENFRENDPEKHVAYEESESSVKPTRLKDKPSSIPAEFFEQDDESKKNLAKAFDHFQKRDWSKCKKLQKDKLICYTCLDENGIKNEECMYVEGSDPVSSHVAYHEKKDYDPAASNVQTNTTEAPLEPPTAETKLKGDFEGVPKLENKTEEPTTTTTTTTERTRKRKHPIKKYQNPETPVTNEPIADDSVIRIYFNKTEPASE